MDLFDLDLQSHWNIKEMYQFQMGLNVQNSSQKIEASFTNRFLLIGALWPVLECN